MPRCRVQDPHVSWRYHFGILISGTTVLTDTGRVVQNFTKGTIVLENQELR